MIVVQFKSRRGKDLRISYPCVVLNVMVAQHNTNDQYQTLLDGPSKSYETSSRMSIEFEVDGPYKARNVQQPLALEKQCKSKKMFRR